MYDKGKRLPFDKPWVKGLSLRTVFKQPEWLLLLSLSKRYDNPSYK